MTDLVPSEPEPRVVAAPTGPPQPTAAGWYPDPDSAGIQRWWTGQGWSDHRAPLVGAVPQGQTVVVNNQRRVNHVLHLILSVCTLGLWIPVWIILALANS